MNKCIEILLNISDVMWFSIVAIIIQVGLLMLNIVVSAYNSRRNRKEKNAVFWLDLHKCFLHFVDLTSELRPIGTSISKSRKPNEKIYKINPKVDNNRLIELLGLFELCESLLEDRLISEHFFERSYLTWCKEIIENPFVDNLVKSDAGNWDLLEKFRERMDKMVFRKKKKTKPSEAKADPAAEAVPEEVPASESAAEAAAIAADKEDRTTDHS